MEVPETDAVVRRARDDGGVARRQLSQRYLELGRRRRRGVALLLFLVVVAIRLADVRLQLHLEVGREGARAGEP